MSSRSMLLVAVLATSFVAPAASAQPVRLRRPYDVARGVNAYYDADGVRGGGAHDHTCRGDTYDGHSGTDFDLDVGTPVMATAAGTVTRTHDGCADVGSLGSTCGGYLGNWVEIRHADGAQTMYAHLQRGSLRVRPGARVTCGQTIGRSASSGNSSGPHLHLGWRPRDTGSWSISGTRDPYAGECGRAASLWTRQGAYGAAPGTECADVDSDGDGVGDARDNCDGVANPGQADLDGDDRGDACDEDDDGDGVPDASDNCPRVPNAPQADANGDGVGNACDGDDDGDGVPDADDVCPRVADPAQADRDGDGAGDACDDADGDGLPDAHDLCPDHADPADGADLDGDGVGDPCDDDGDGDGVPNAEDVCPHDADADQLDADGDGVGDACDEPEPPGEEPPPEGGDADGGVPVAPPGPGSIGGGCHVAGRGARSTAAWWVALAVLALARSRRRG